MNPELLNRLSSVAWIDPMAYGLESPIAQAMPVQANPQMEEAPVQWLSDMIEMIAPAVMNASNDDVLMFISDVLKLKWL